MTHIACILTTGSISGSFVGVENMGRMHPHRVHEAVAVTGNGVVIGTQRHLNAIYVIPVMPVGLQYFINADYLGEP